MDDDDMAWVHFTDDFDWEPTLRSTVAYKAGMELSVTRSCADAAKAAGKAVDAATPSRPAAPAVDRAMEIETEDAPEDDDGGQAPGAV